MACTTDFKEHVESYRKFLEKNGAHCIPPTRETKKPPSIPKFTKEDVLIVVDCQNDFVPENSFDVPNCGAFTVKFGDSVCTKVSELIQRASAVGATVVATRDYHPAGHCSFCTAVPAGPFPPHCVQGSLGANFTPPITTALNAAIRAGRNNTHIAYKGYAEFIDSFGGFPYATDDALKTRLSNSDPSPKYDRIVLSSVENVKMVDGSEFCSLHWSGGTILKCSCQDKDANAPPDVMAILNKKAHSLATVLGRRNRLFVCGLALDFCVLDTAVNASQLPGRPFQEIYLVYDAAASAHIAGVGQFEGGYLSDPAVVAGKLKQNHIYLVTGDDL